MDGMVCSLFNWSYFRGTLTRNIRIGVGTKANFAPGAHHWDGNGCCATICSATGTGSGNRFLQDSHAGLQLHQKPDGAHGLWTWSIPGGSRDSPLVWNRRGLHPSSFFELHLVCHRKIPMLAGGPL